MVPPTVIAAVIDPVWPPAVPLPCSLAHVMRTTSAVSDCVTQNCDAREQEPMSLSRHCSASLGKPILVRRRSDPTVAGILTCRPLTQVHDGSNTRGKGVSEPGMGLMANLLDRALPQEVVEHAAEISSGCFHTEEH
jgi:hypothetical protein